MGNVIHPILGAIDPSSPGFWDATITFAGRGVFFDLTIDGEELTAADLADFRSSRRSWSHSTRAARLAILEDAQSGDEDAAAFLYVTHHQKVLSPDDFRRLFGTDRPDLGNLQPLLSRLVLVRVGLYPEDEDQRILLDYSIGPDVTDYLLSVSFNLKRQPTGVDLESSHRLHCSWWRHWRRHDDASREAASAEASGTGSTGGSARWSTATVRWPQGDRGCVSDAGRRARRGVSLGRRRDAGFEVRILARRDADVLPRVRRHPRDLLSRFIPARSGSRSARWMMTRGSGRRLMSSWPPRAPWFDRNQRPASVRGGIRRDGGRAAEAGR